MFRLRTLVALFSLIFAPAGRAQLGKSVMIPAGSEADRQISAINAASDPAQKLQLIDQFSQAHPDGDLQIVADEQYVSYYINTKQYDKAYEYGDKSAAILQRFKATPAPEGTASDKWTRIQTEKLESIKDNENYIEQSL